MDLADPLTRLSSQSFCLLTQVIPAGHGKKRLNHQHGPPSHHLAGSPVFAHSCQVTAVYCIQLPVVPHKAVAKVSMTRNYSESLNDAKL